MARKSKDEHIVNKFTTNGEINHNTASNDCSEVQEIGGSPMTSDRPKIIIIGAGFGGLSAARALENGPVDVLLIDRRNYHTFTPLLYQVATCGLEPEEIAYPVRGIFGGQSNVRFLMGEVEQIDADQRSVTVRSGGQTRREGYDSLIVAGGSVSSYFGHDELALHSFSLKDLNDSVTLRNHILSLFERAAWIDDAAKRQALTTLVIVGGGPTGLETAGALRELVTHALRKEYGFGEANRPRVILIEATDSLLRSFPEGLRESALRQVESLGIEVMLNSAVADVAADHVRLSDGRVIPTSTLVWSAGVQAAPLTALLNLPLAAGQRVPIKPTTEVIGRAGIYVVGDMAYLPDPDGRPYPMLIPVAQQQGKLAAKNILRRMAGQAEQSFHYRDRGAMATIGRSRAVAYLYNRIPVSGYLAWVVWLGLHLLTLMGFRNRLAVLLNWVWQYWTYDRSVRVILERNEVADKPQDDPLPRTT